MAFGQITMLTTTPDADAKGNVDCFVGTGKRLLPIAYRRRRLGLARFGEISIRHDRKVTRAKTEYQKMLDGECKAVLYVYDFLDCWVLVPTSEILRALKSGIGHAEANHDGMTDAYYIHVSKITHWKIPNAKGVCW